MAKKDTRPDDDQIYLIIRAIEPDGTRAGRGTEVAEWDEAEGGKFRRQPVSKAKLALQMQTFCKALGQVIDQSAAYMGNFELDEVKMKVELTSTGEVCVVAATGSVSATGGLEFTFKRRKSPARPKPAPITPTQT
jgi:hypothetical protein